MNIIPGAHTDFEILCYFIYLRRTNTEDDTDKSAPNKIYVVVISAGAP